MIMNSDTENPDDRDQDGLDELLGAWHEDVDGRARAARKRVLEASGAADASERNPILGRISMYSYARYLPYAAVIGIAVLIAFLASPQLTKPSFAQDGVVMLPDGGRLDAFDKDGNEIGPCALEHTDVHASVSGHIVRVDVEQVFGNPYEAAIEAVYTFPLSHRGAVDRMRMTIRSGEDERIVEGEIEERDQARQMYEDARDAGYVASLLEQERPNIFTQSVANIEPGAEIVISISYVETLEELDGTYSLVFPTVVGPRYIPGYPQGGIELPPGCVARTGIVLRGPAKLAVEGDDVEDDGTDLLLLVEGNPIERPAWTEQETKPELVKSFKVSYTDGSGEPGAFFADNTGVIGNRWFCWETPEPGAPFAVDTDQVPDASRITPMPVRPGTRAGHDISITVEIETGGAQIATVDAPLHEIKEIAPAAGKGSKGRKVFELASKDAIPNRDFVLEWTLGSEGIDESILVHADLAQNGDVDGHLAIILNPPPRVEDADVPARELIFVLDTSGSMRGFPIEKAKAVMKRAIDAMRPDDTFNMITFAGDTHILWDAPRPATKENRAIATQFLASREGGGGTEMMKAINAALVQGANAGSRIDATALANLPADGRTVKLRIAYVDLADGSLKVGDELSIPFETTIALPEMPGSKNLEVDLDGQWVTKDGQRVLVLDKAAFVEDGDTSNAPMRIVVFMTDGYVGDDQTIIAAVRENAATTRVFSFGIGNSVNRYLLDGMAEAGRGAVEYVLLNDGADEAVDRFSRRIKTPVLIDLSIETEGIELVDVLPSGQYLPDLYDEKPIVILARYTKPGEGTITLRGRTGNGPWSREITLDLPAEEEDHDVVATLWARAMVDEILDPHLAELQSGTVEESVEERVVALGKKYSIMTPYTSFVAIEKTRIVSDGKPMLVRIPIELPSGTDWEGFFGNPEADPIDASLEQLALGIPVPAGANMLLVDDAVKTFEVDGLEPKEKMLGLVTSTVIPPSSARRLGGLDITREQGKSNHWYAQPKTEGQANLGTHMYYGQSAPAEWEYGVPSPGRDIRRIGGGGGGIRTRSGLAADKSSVAESLASDAEIHGESDQASEDDVSSERTDESVETPELPRFLEPEQFQHLARVLDRPLFRLAVLSILPEELSAVVRLGDEKSLVGANGTVLVSIKLDAIDDARLAKLKKAGFKVLGVNKETRILAGRATPRQLVDIGLLDGVLRIVPTRVKAETSS